MNSINIDDPRVLAIAPCVQGIGFVVFNGPRVPIDWGVKWVRDEKNAKGEANVAALIERYQPDVVVFEDYRGEGSKRAKRIEDLLDAIAALVRRRKIKTARYTGLIRWAASWVPSQPDSGCWKRLASPGRSLPHPALPH